MAGLEAVVVGLERVVGYIVVEQKRKKLGTHLLCSGYVTACSERWVSQLCVLTKSQNKNKDEVSVMVQQLTLNQRYLRSF